MTFKDAGQHTDIKLRRDPDNSAAWLAKTWDFEITRNGIPLILTDSDLTIVLLDNGTEVATLTVDKTNAHDGVLACTLPAELIPSLGRYTTWQLYEAPQYNDVLVQGRFEKR